MPEELYRRPSKQEIQAAVNKKVPDIIAPGLKVLFCGINPGLYTAAAGHHFARPGNRFWPVLHLSGFTHRLLAPFEEKELIKYGYGITNVVERATVSADELSKEEYKAGGKLLEKKLLEYKPEYIAVLGIGAYKTAFNMPEAKMGLQSLKIGTTTVWVLPSPSGLNAHYQLHHLVEMFRQLFLKTHSLN